MQISDMLCCSKNQDKEDVVVEIGQLGATSGGEEQNDAPCNVTVDRGVRLVSEFDGLVRIKMRTLALGWDQVTIGAMRRGDEAKHKALGAWVQVQVKFEDGDERCVTVESSSGEYCTVVIDRERNLNSSNSI